MAALKPTDKVMENKKEREKKYHGTSMLLQCTIIVVSNKAWFPSWYCDAAAVFLWCECVWTHTVWSVSGGRTMVFSMVFITSFHSSFSTLLRTVFSQILANRVRLRTRTHITLLTQKLTSAKSQCFSFSFSSLKKLNKNWNK